MATKDKPDDLAAVQLPRAVRGALADQLARCVEAEGDILAKLARIEQRLDVLERKSGHAQAVDSLMHGGTTGG